MHERLARIQEHIEDHKTAYACAITGVVTAGFTFFIMRTNGLYCGRLYDQRNAKDVYTTKAYTNIGSNFVSNSTINGNVISNVGKKALSYIIQEDGENRWWISQADVARETGHSESNISKHLNYDRPLSDGLTLIRRGISA